MKFTKFFIYSLFFYLFYILFVKVTYILLSYFTIFNGNRLTLTGLLLEAMILFLFVVFILLVTKRILFSNFIVSSIYVFFLLANLEKIRFFNTPVFPVDITHIKELILAKDVFITYLPYLILMFAIIVSSFFFFLRYERKFKSLNKTYWYIWFFLVFVISSVFVFKSQIKESLVKKDLIRFGRSHVLSSSERYGLLFEFFKQIIYKETLIAPKNYGNETIHSIIKNITKKNKVSFNKNENINLIIYLIESFTDPYENGFKTSKDPIPFFHKLQQNYESGKLYSPVVGGMSGNAEFEILTGFSTYFFPQSAIPYADIPYRKIPSLARELNAYDYFTAALHVADLGFFNYKAAYKMQGFDYVSTLWNKQGIQKDPQGRFPSDEELVNEIINVANKHKKFFIFAFPNSTHGKWNYHAYDNSPLRIINNNTSFNEGNKALNTYINALNTADKAIKKLITHFKINKQKVIILVLGDHQPGIPEYREKLMFSNFINLKSSNFKTRKEMKKAFLQYDQKHRLKTYKTMHTVPYVIWSNFLINNKYTYQKGFNSLIPKLFDYLKIQPNSSFYIFLKNYSKSVDYTSFINYIYSEKNSNINNLIENYRAIQYDILFGENYIKKQ